MCHGRRSPPSGRRFPDSTVEYVLADLLAPPPSWQGAFDLVVEIFTLQVVTGQARRTAFAHTAQLVAPGGRLLVLAGARDEDDLTASSIGEVIDDESRGPVRRWTAGFDRPVG
jgi:hypothetical protein